MARKRSPPASVELPAVDTVTSKENGSVDPTKGVSMKVDFSAVASSYEPRAKGEYEGTLIGHKLNAASATSGQPTVTLDWSENDSPNRHMFKTYSLQPVALWSLKRDLIRIGADVEAMNSPDADLDVIITGLYGYVSTLVFGDPRPGTDKEGKPRLFDNFLYVKDQK